MMAVSLVQDQPDHGGFWMSAFLVGLIDVVVVAPLVVWTGRSPSVAPPAWLYCSRAQAVAGRPPTPSQSGGPHGLVGSRRRR